jgi:hypothetical protein
LIAPSGPGRFPKTAARYTNAKYYFVQSGIGFSMQNKEPDKGVAALHPAEVDTVLREKTRCDDERMFWIGIGPIVAHIPLYDNSGV